MRSRHAPHSVRCLGRVIEDRSGSGYVIDFTTIPPAGADHANGDRWDANLFPHTVIARRKGDRSDEPIGACGPTIYYLAGRCSIRCAESSTR